MLSYCICEVQVRRITVDHFIHFRLRFNGQSGNQLSFSKGTSRLVLTTEPLRIDVYSNDDPVISINSQGLLKFEHTRPKP